MPDPNDRDLAARFTGLKNDSVVSYPQTKGVRCPLQFADTMRKRIAFERSSFTALFFQMISKSGVTLELSLHFGMRDRFLKLPLSNNGQVVKIFQQLFVLLKRQNHGFALSILVGDEVRVRSLCVTQKCFLPTLVTLLPNAQKCKKS